MNKILKATILIVLGTLIFGGGYATGRGHQYFSVSNGVLFFNLDIYQLLQAKNYQRVNEDLKGSILLNYYVLDKYNMVNDNIKNDKTKMAIIQGMRQQPGSEPIIISNDLSPTQTGQAN